MRLPRSGPKFTRYAKPRPRCSSANAAPNRRLTPVTGKNRMPSSARLKKQGAGGRLGFRVPTPADVCARTRGVMRRLLGTLLWRELFGCEHARFFLCKDTAPAEIYPLALHHGLAIYVAGIERSRRETPCVVGARCAVRGAGRRAAARGDE